MTIGPNTIDTVWAPFAVRKGQHADPAYRVSAHRTDPAGCLPCLPGFVLSNTSAEDEPLRQPHPRNRGLRG
jgi:hypothetical protein